MRLVNIRDFLAGWLAAAPDQSGKKLLRDLKSRGLLEDTLVVWTTEFGRTPRDGWPDRRRATTISAFSSWLAGGGVKGGIAYGKTDDYGHEVAEDPVHTHDFHATILKLLGFDHEKLTFRHAGRDFRLTDVSGTGRKSDPRLNAERRLQHYAGAAPQRQTQFLTAVVFPHHDKLARGPIRLHAKEDFLFPL